MAEHATTMSPPIAGLRRIDGCVVTDSSGCHRYDYWNEQALFDSRPDTGWCSVSRDVPTAEFLDIDLGARRPVAGVRLLSRAVNENKGFPETVEVLVRDGTGSWRRVHHAKGIRVPVSTWVDLTFPPFLGDQVRLFLSDVAMRPEGKYFTQFMCLEILSAEEGGR
jgi:F5/8 type C domain